MNKIIKINKKYIIILNSKKLLLNTSNLNILCKQYKILSDVDFLLKTPICSEKNPHKICK
jgi:hypothetical protein